MLTLLRFRCILNNGMTKADHLGFKLADGRIFPLLDLKKQDFTKVELQAADRNAGKVCLHFVLTKKGKPVEEYSTPLSIDFTPESADDLILQAVRSGSNYISTSLFLRKHPEEAVKLPLRILSEEEMELERAISYRRRRNFVTAALAFFTTIAVSSAVALTTVLLLHSFLQGGFL